MTQPKFSEVLSEFLNTRETILYAKQQSLDCDELTQILGELATQLDNWFEQDSEVIRVEDPAAPVRPDIVTLLHKASAALHDFGLDDKSLYRDAADEIARLRVTLSAIRSNCRSLNSPIRDSIVAVCDAMLGPGNKHHK